MTKHKRRVLSQKLAYSSTHSSTRPRKKKFRGCILYLSLFVFVVVALDLVYTAAVVASHSARQVRRQTQQTEDTQGGVTLVRTTTPPAPMAKQAVAINVTYPPPQQLQQQLQQQPQPQRRTNTKTSITSLPFIPTAVKYVKPKADRIGSKLLDLLKAHAYCFHKHWEFKGYCGSAHDHTGQNTADMLRAFGLDQLIPKACPPGTTMSPRSKYFPQDIKEKYFVNYKDYRHNETATFTQEWLDFMRQVVPDTNLAHKHDSETLQIAVHVRRGDVSLCTDNAKRRYLPNSHYIRLIDQVLAKYPKNQRYQVTIYSESLHHNRKTRTQYEGFDEFVARNYTLHLDGTIEHIWKRFQAADVLILAMSGFSVVPALLRLHRPGVVFTPHQNAYMLPHWELVSEETMQLMADERKALQIDRCPQHGQEVDFFDDPFHDYERHYYQQQHHQQQQQDAHNHHHDDVNEVRVQSSQ